MIIHEEQEQLFDAIARMGSAGRAEGEDGERLPRTFWPVPEHMRAFDPDVVLIVGPRGAGKTELFRAVIDRGLLPAIAGVLDRIRLPPLESDRTRWIAGYPIGTGFPSHLQIREYVRQRQATDEHFVEVWLAYLLRSLQDEVQDAELKAVYAPVGGDIATVVQAFQQSMRQALLALDNLDQRLYHKDRYLFVAYDELDTLARGDSDITRFEVW